MLEANCNNNSSRDIHDSSTRFQSDITTRFQSDITNNGEREDVTPLH